GINDAGDIAGTIFETDGTDRAFYRIGGVDAIFSLPSFPSWDFRNLGNRTPAYPKGLAVGYAWGVVPTGDMSSYGFVYDPSHGFTNFISGFSYPVWVAQGINSSQQIVGHVVSAAPNMPQFSGFLYTPVGGDPFFGGSLVPFNIAGFSTRARGINDHGLIV